MRGMRLHERVVIVVRFLLKAARTTQAIHPVLHLLNHAQNGD